MTDEREIGTKDSRIIRYRSVIYDKKCLISFWTITESTKRQMCRIWFGQVKLGFLGVFP